MKEKQQVINLSHIELQSIANGPGTRTVAWVQGCERQCKGCINQHTWSQEDKDLVGVDALFTKIMNNHHLIEGVTFSGGEPFLQAMALAELSRRLKAEGLSIAVFSGFTLEQLKSQVAPPGSQELLQEIDLLIDSPYIQEQHSDNLVLRGSLNQKLIFLTDRYSLQDINCPKVEIEVSHQNIFFTGFCDKNLSDFAGELLNAIMPE